MLGTVGLVSDWLHLIVERVGYHRYSKQDSIIGLEESYLLARLGCIHGMHRRIAGVGRLPIVEVDGNGEGVEREKVNGVRFSDCIGNVLGRRLQIV
jgi:hypothetical protein